MQAGRRQGAASTAHILMANRDPQGAEIVEGLRRDERWAAERFFDNYHRLIYGLIHRSGIVDHQNIDDAFNDFFVHLSANKYHRLVMWNGNSSLTTYMWTLLKNFLVDQHRKERRKTSLALDDVSEEVLTDADGGDEVDEALYISQLARLTKSAKFELAERDKEIICRRHYKDHAPEMIASDLGITLNAYYVAASRAEKRLLSLIRGRHPEIFEEFV